MFPGGPRAGYFSESGRWDICSTIDTDQVPAGHSIGSVNLTAATTQPMTQTGSIRYTPFEGAVDLPAVRDAAVARSAPPQPARTGRTPIDGSQTIVKLPTWFWVEEDYWRPYVGTATSPAGRLTVTVTATPTQTEWDTGEGVIICDQGMEYWRGRDPYISNCMIEYQHSTTVTSAGYHQIAGTITFETAWELDFDNAPGFRLGRLADQTSTDTYQLKVGEIHALIINPNRPTGATGECFHCAGTTEITDF